MRWEKEDGDSSEESCLLVGFEFANIRNTVPKQNKVNMSMKTSRSMSGSRTRTKNELLSQSANLVMFSNVN